MRTAQRHTHVTSMAREHASAALIEKEMEVRLMWTAGVAAHGYVEISESKNRSSQKGKDDGRIRR